MAPANISLISESMAIFKRHSSSDLSSLTSNSRLQGSEILTEITPSSASTVTGFEGTKDSGYSSQSTTPSSNASAGGETNNLFSSILFPQKKPLFNVNVDEATEERFKIVQGHFEKLLLEYVREHQPVGAKYKPMSTRLIMIGTSSSDAVPHLVVFCQPKQKRLVEQFATSHIIKDICQPPDPGVPSFKIKVIGKGPKLRLKNSQVEVTVDNVIPIWHRDTLCGTPIQFTRLCDKRNATFGGIIKVVTEKGDVKLYGVTAGHAVEEWDNNEFESSLEGTDDHGDDTEQPTPEDSDMDMDLFMIDIPPEVGSDDGKESWHFAEPLVLGSIITHASAPTTDAIHHNDQCYDWALFETSVYKSNHLPYCLVPEIPEVVLSQREPGTTGDRTIYMISDSGFKWGQLTSTPGRILLGSGEEFVTTYMLMIHDEPGICDGDSGSWVIDNCTYEVYGHLVASDVFGSGYVIPLKAIFADIKQRLRAELVALPTVADVKQAQKDADQSAKNTSSTLGFPEKTTYSRISRKTVSELSNDSGYSSVQISPSSMV
ncbi:hypothetical protein F4806DRAFT_132327 [Annulohypoxylon nitens]|nr:hypothetical protein F4806DRAFT_132327 [Annulohypoxylon nitens]